MQRYAISVSSVTHAIKGRDLLRKSGYKAYIEKRTNSKGNAGCGYVIIAEGNRSTASDILKNSGIKILKIENL